MNTGRGGAISRGDYKYRVALQVCLAYNADMATNWKIYKPADGSAETIGTGSSVSKWEDTEVTELTKLARSATETARKSIRLINAAKAEACRKQLLQEMKTAQ